MSSASIPQNSGLEATAPNRRGFALPARRTLIASGIAVAAAIAGALWIIAPATSESTDDAYVGADTTTVAPKIRGLVAEVLVRDNQVVKAGDPLVRIDGEEFDAHVATARAELADAQAGVASAQAALVSLDSEEQLAAANIRAAQTAIRSGKAESERAAVDSRRYDALVTSGAVSQRDADRFHSAAITAEQDSARSAALLEVTRRAQSVTGAIGIAHAGAMLWFADVCATVLTFGETRMEPGASGFPLAINLNAAFTGNQKDGVFTATSTFVKRGRSLSVVRTEVTGEGGRLIADVTTSHVPSK